jgi:hypothetical protein
MNIELFIILGWPLKKDSYICNRVPSATGQCRSQMSPNQEDGPFEPHFLCCPPACKVYWKPVFNFQTFLWIHTNEAQKEFVVYINFSTEFTIRESLIRVVLHVTPFSLNRTVFYFKVFDLNLKFFRQTQPSVSRPLFKFRTVQLTSYFMSYSYTVCCSDGNSRRICPLYSQR